jgi:hypothetical protein
MLGAKLNTLMTKRKAIIGLLALISVTAAIYLVVSLRPDNRVELYVLAGQSNAQGFAGNADGYPQDPGGLDPAIPFFYKSPGVGGSDNRWISLGPQNGLFPKGYFGPEVSFARALKSLGGNPSIFKFTLYSTSLAAQWKAPGEGGLYDEMCHELSVAIRDLEQKGKRVKMSALIWIQGESDAETDEMSARYYDELSLLIRDFRKRFGVPDLPVVLGVDEQHPWVRERNGVVAAQQKLDAAEELIVFCSMEGLEKFDTSHLTPAGLVKHGERIFQRYEEIKKDGRR